MSSCATCRHHRTHVDVGLTHRDRICLERNVGPHVVAHFQLGPDDDTGCPSYDDVCISLPPPELPDAELTRRASDPHWRGRTERRAGGDRRAFEREQGDRRSTGAMR